MGHDESSKKQEEEEEGRLTFSPDPLFLKGL